ncbi:hypothetical protein ACMFCN_28420 [Klebsiella michiganensis]|uniref:hypothetical protein n=1 Tax=Klebsiella michiganensis TaxID=1134687 RepID=UPI003CF0A9E0
MTDITELAQSHELLIANGNETANLLRHLANNEIDSDYFAVVSECESYGQETEAELSITEFAIRAAGYVDELVEALEKAQAKNALVAGGIEAAAKLHERIAELESRTVKLPRPGFVTISGERTAVYLKADVDAVLAAAGIKREAE